MSSGAEMAVDASAAVDQAVSAGEVVLYVDADGTVNLDVRLERENLWLTQKQMAELFATERSVITKHLNNIFGSGELDRESNVQKVHIATSDRPVAMYGLDAIISVGYRVNSKRGTRFRIWATKVLHEHLTKGYTANERRLTELNQTIRLISEVVDRRDLSGDEAKALLAIVGEYSFALDLLDNYDRHSVASPPEGEKVTRYLAHEEVLRIVDRRRERFGGGSPSALLRRQEPPLRRRQQAHRCGVVPMVPGDQWWTADKERGPTTVRSGAGGHYASDGGKRAAGEGSHHQSSDPFAVGSTWGPVARILRTGFHRVAHP